MIIVNYTFSGIHFATKNNYGEKRSFGQISQGNFAKIPQSPILHNSISITFIFYIKC